MVEEGIGNRKRETRRRTGRLGDKETWRVAKERRKKREERREKKEERNGETTMRADKNS